MRFSYTGILLISIVSAALAVSGCMQSLTGPGPSNATVSASGSPVSAGPGSSTTGGGIPAMDFKDLTAFEYRFNTTTGDTPIVGDLKSVNSTAPFGGVTNARLTQTNITANTAAGLSITAVDIYSDSSGSVLGGHIRVEVGGQLLANRDLTAGEQVDSSQTSTPALTAAANAGAAKGLKNAGLDQVSVPAGSFACTKYVLQGEASTMTYWIAPGVPIPVKMTQTDAVTSKVTMTMELVGYR